MEIFGELHKCRYYLITHCSCTLSVMEADIAGTRVAVVGHSFIRRLKDDLDTHYYYESNPNFDLHQCTVSLKGSGGWHVLDRDRFEASFK